MPSREEIKVEDTYAMKPIPLELRKSWRVLLFFYAGMVMVLAAFMGGATMLVFLPFNYAVVAYIIGLILLFLLFFYPTALAGAREGLNTYMLGTAAFGYRGSDIATALIITAIPSIAWYGVEVWLASAAWAIVFGWNPGGPNTPMDLPAVVATVLMGILFAIPPIIGITSVTWVNYVSVPVMLALLGYGIYLGLTRVGFDKVVSYGPSLSGVALALNVFMAINATIGLIAEGSSFAADVSRWVKPSKKGIALAGLLGLVGMAILFGVVGMFYAVAGVQAGLDPSLSWNLILVLDKLGVAKSALWPLLLLTVLLQWTTCMTAVYTAELALTKIFGRGRALWGLFTAVVGTILTILGIVWQWIPFLNALATWIPPATAVVVAEYYIVSRGKYVGSKGAIHWPGFLAWLVGGLVAYLLNAYPYFVPALVGYGVAMAIYVAIETTIHKHSS